MKTGVDLMMEVANQNVKEGILIEKKSCTERTAERLQGYKNAFTNKK